MQLDFDIKRNLHKFQDLTEPHCHDLLEILVCLADGGKFISGDEKLPLYCGTVHIVKKGVCTIVWSKYPPMSATLSTFPMKRCGCYPASRRI